MTENRLSIQTKLKSWPEEKTNIVLLSKQIKGHRHLTLYKISLINRSNYSLNFDKSKINKAVHEQT